MQRDQDEHGELRIATRALAAGRSVTLLGTEAAKAQALAGQLSGAVRAGTVGDPITGT